MDSGRFEPASGVSEANGTSEVRIRAVPYSSLFYSSDGLTSPEATLRASSSQKAVFGSEATEGSSWLRRDGGPERPLAHCVRSRYDDSNAPPRVYHGWCDHPAPRMPTFTDLSRAAYCPRQLYYARREDDREPPPEAVARRNLAFRYPELRDAADATLSAEPVDLEPGSRAPKARSIPG